MAIPTNFMLEDNLLRYIPAKIRPYLTTLYCMHHHTYSVIIEIDGTEYCGIADSVSELRHAANYMFDNRTDYGM